MSEIFQIQSLVAEALCTQPPFSALFSEDGAREALCDAVTCSEDNHWLISLGFACQSWLPEIKAAIQRVANESSLTCSGIDVYCNVSGAEQGSKEPVPGVKHIIAVASGKGGVGKSTTSVNLALALSHEGAKVGILDADIYGPSQPHMLGVGDKRPETKGNTIIPLSAHGISVISMGNLVTEKTPMVWRGPMVSGALQQLLRSSNWLDIDYLVIDMPPGTGDIQLTLSQTVPVSGAVIVTTPQDIALLDAKKGIEMFDKVSIPVLGVVENMATHVCSNCGHTEAIFGENGGQALADGYQTELLGQLPLELAIREQTDSGVPPLVRDPESKVSLEYRSIARKVGAKVWFYHQSAPAAPVFSVDED